MLTTNAAPERRPTAARRPPAPARRCACGGTVGPSGECAACKARRLAREAAGGPAPGSVQAALRSGGEPLPVEVRRTMERSFGHDFGAVRIHADGAAGRSADEIDAAAYSHGTHVVFGPGRYRPATSAGQALIAHELAHVVQTRPDAASGPPLVVASAGDPSERDADRAAALVAHGRPAPGLGRVPGAVRRQLRSGPSTSPVPDGGASDAGTAPDAGTGGGLVCGPNITDPLTKTVAKTRRTFGTWSAADKTSACDALDSLTTGGVAWDINELHSNAWIYLHYRPACATAGGSPACGSSVQVGSDCHYAGSVNYVIFGVMCDLCHSHFTAAGSASGAARFTEPAMLHLVDVYKGHGFTGLATPSANFVPSQRWSSAGYHGWPAAAAPPGDRSNCAPTCARPAPPGPYSVHWIPHGWF
jgi:Domain of unknown function (DUF4157)